MSTLSAAQLVDSAPQSLPIITDERSHDQACAPEQPNDSESKTDGTDPGPSEEQALESHEVIELQTFSDRKAWIEEKIKFLEGLPPVEVFAGIEAIKSSSLDVPGLASREELQRWMVEHDIIEKETEIFDTGELAKLRQLTKAATQRNLSPEDTDVIELTLTTIYALDKLLHLLRDRSENLEMLNIRLTWEEHRQASWTERRQIIDTLHSFCVSRARWNPSIYEQAPRTDETNSSETTRRNSVASLASATSELSTTSPAFSRTARFKTAELLSRDAAQFSGRVTSLRHGKVVAAGKALDKLIDHSRKPVPDELLDEQDRVEEKCITQLENIGKFTMGLVMQWRKADEIYVETMKDNASASTLFEEIETAKLYHPTARQSASFNSRIDTILKRLAVRGDPSSLGSMFPCPEHPLFNDQRAANVALAKNLSADISATTALARKVEAAAKEYRVSHEAVKRMETLLQSTSDLSSTIEVLVNKFRDGVSANDEDGSPPSLLSDGCLDPTSHSVFLALLPSLCEETTTAVQNADKLLRGLTLALLDLEQPGIEVTFKENAATSVRRLRDLKASVTAACQERVQQASRLREARKIATNLHACHALLRECRDEIAECMERERWRQETSGADTPPTPQSPGLPLVLSNDVYPHFDDQLARLSSKISSDVRTPLERISPTLETPLLDCLQKGLVTLNTLLESNKQMFKCLVALKNQSTAMKAIKEDYNKLLLRIEDHKMQIEDAIEDVLGDKSLDHIPSDSELQQGIESIRAEVQMFSSGLSSRVPFIARGYKPPSDHLLHPLPLEVKLKSPHQQSFNALPFDLVMHDAAVRTDGNAFVMRINGRFDNLQHSKKHLEIAKQARDVDVSISSVLGSVDTVIQNLANHRIVFSEIKPRSGTVDAYRACLEQLQALRSRRSTIGRSFSPIRNVLRRMEQQSKSLEPSVRDALCGSRAKVLDSLSNRLNEWERDTINFQEEVTKALAEEVRYQKELEVETERCRQEEEQRKKAEEEGRLRLEHERILKEEEDRRLQEQLAKEREEELERLRIVAEHAAQEAARKEAEEAEKRCQMEEERQAEQARLEAEQARRELEEAERLRQGEERAEMLAKLRLAEAQLEEERRRHAESEQAAADLARKRQEELEELERHQQEIQRLKEEAALATQGRNDTPKESLGIASLTNERIFSQPKEESDVFGSPTSPKSFAPDFFGLQAKILALRKRLRSICIDESLNPVTASTDLPSQVKVETMNKAFKAVSWDVDQLPSTVDDNVLTSELDALRAEVLGASSSLVELAKLAVFSTAVHDCDAALSDLLEHIDSYPAIPLGVLSSPHKSNPSSQPEEQMMARLTFTNNLIENMTAKFGLVSTDNRSTAEHTRAVQTWAELEEMATDKIRQKSRPPSTSSARSSGRASSVSINPPQNSSSRAARKKNSYSHLSVSSISSVPSRGGLLAPPAPRQHTPRRVVSGSSETPSRSSSRMSTASTNRSVSGPLRSSIYGTTFASRQRTTSLTNSEGPKDLPPPGKLAMPRSRSRLFSESHRSKSPLSENSNPSLSGITTSRSSSGPTWARAPRDSFSSMLSPRVTTPVKKVPPAVRKKYVADPKSKLDVAVGDVVNQLPVGINVEGITESWRDQSGKYWIGNQDPKLCFCRILRSQTVMVRVGGGWQELSKFIKGHFAESFRIMPESPSRAGAREEKWISSATLLEVQENESTEIPEPPKTPEPTVPFLPSFSLMTPSAQSPHSIRSATPSTKGSPLMPLQFIRRADPEHSTPLRPVTPSKPSRSRQSNIGTTPIRNSVWRP